MRRDGTGRGPLVPAVLVAGSLAPDMTFCAANVPPGVWSSVRSRTRSPASSRSMCSSPGRWWGCGCRPANRCSRCCPGPRRAGRPRCCAAVCHARVRAVAVGWWYVSAALGALTHVVWDAFTP
ncbi:zinc dependent phospholipase C family protein [Streptomyces sp. NPDC048665]|uniref:zinc dependent phospholipase C family protein n=1 Tax=Streptomyces sp. NPDC048665 TaxID=3155490 RepID=UPI003436B1A8